MNRHPPHWRVLLLAVLVGVVPPAAAQLRYRLPPEEPQWFKMKITETSLGVYSEGIFESAKLTGGSSVEYSRIFVGPTVGLKAQGSVYHPNLARYIFSGEMAVGWADERVDSGTSSSRKQLDELGNLQSTLYLLNNKPYASSLFANYDHTFRDYDFFNRTVVNSWRYGGQTGYREGPVPFTISVWNLNEEERNVMGFATTTNTSPSGTNLVTSPIFGTTSLQQISVTFDAHNDRANGGTRFTYGLSDYDRGDFGTTAGSTDHTFGLADNETFGSRKQITWNNDLGYSLRRFTDAPSDDFNANSHLNIDHSATVSSSYGADYYHSTYADNASDNYSGSGSVRHQLYQSLSSTLTVDGQRYDASGPDGSSGTKRFGTSLTEGYTKQLSSSANLRVNGTLGVSHTDVSQNGSSITIIDEPHSFPTGVGGGPVGTFSLNQPNVNMATIVISDPPHSQTYLEGTDYTLSRNGLLTFVTRIGGSRIPAGGAVVVTYSAVPSPSGEYNTLNGILQVRLEFWNGLLGVYGRVNSVQNHGTPGLVVQDLSAFAAGTDVTWRFLRAGAEFEVYDSNFSSYRAARFYQSLMFQPDDASTLNFDFLETWTTYLDPQREENMFTFINRYHRRLTRHLGLDFEGGISLRRGPGTDQTLATARPGLDFAVGKLSLKVGYDFQYSQFLDSEERFKHMFFLRLKRTF